MARVLLIIGGGIAAYKASELIRLLKKRGHQVTPVLTAGGAHFVTPMTLAALAESPVYTSLWDLKDETDMGHIQLSRAADLVLVCPATADLIAKMAAGIADDLATTLLVATDKPVVVAPAMNVRMWLHPATQRNVARLKADGVRVIEPDEGAMACGEFGPGRLPEPARIVEELKSSPAFAGERASRASPQDASAARDHPKDGGGASRLATKSPSTSFAGPPPLEIEGRNLAGTHILVTAGPTHEPIDPVRVIANRSSGKQGFAIAEAAVRAGARVTLVAGPVALPTPGGVARIDVETAEQMAQAVEAALPADVAILVAAVADWKVAPSPLKLKKREGPPQLTFSPNRDILAELAESPERPRLLIGFAAETDDLVANAESKRRAKGADWILANDVSGDVMGGNHNQVHLVTANGDEEWEEATKQAVARRLIARIAE
ncbi:MAG: bifunctional phosphopantothenoylcysteine decarboxylase/phosphopantothenate synthase, partial [Sphingomonadales bacterium]|nr:bifunctional phosphopantothenoylcysteine decarboxylase/phosphopantothenate synthase [Sphingomonadales bacterium]